jgi:thiamine biosynthesis lipoprotein
MKNAVVRSRPLVKILLVGILAVGVLSFFGIYRVKSVPQLYHQAQFLLDTLVEMTVACRSEQQANEAMSAAYEEMRRIEALLSRYRNGSQISQLNTDAGKDQVVQVSREVHDILQRSLQYAVLTDGLFDITIGPIVDLWGIGTPYQQVPDESELQRVLPYVGYQNVEISENGGIRLRYPEVKLDLGGIAKGYSIDRAIEVLRGYDMISALVNAGGDIRGIGTKPDGTPWRIGIQHPRKPNDIVGVIQLQDAAVATSGDYERFFMHNNIRYHHIFVPHTGMPAQACQSVTIITKTAEAADVFATAVFVMGPERGLKFIEDQTDVEGMIIDSDGNMITSSGFSFKIWN